MRNKTYTNRKLRQWGVWNYWDPVHVLNVRRHEIRRIWISSYLEFMEGNFKQSFYIKENMTTNIKICVYNLCLTLSLGHKVLYPATGTFLRKIIDIESVLWTLCNVRNIKVPFFSSSTHFTVFSFAIDAAQLVWCIPYFNLKIFPGSVFSAQKL